MIVLGIDPGLTQKNPTGWAVVNIDVLALQASGPALLPSQETWDDRIPSLYRQLTALAVKYPIDLIAYEYPHARNFTNDRGQAVNNYQTAIKLAHVGGLVQGIAAALGVPCVGVQPSEAKKALTGNGAASKDEMIMAVSMIFSRTISKDEADAVGVAMAGAIAWQNKQFAAEFGEGWD